MIKSFKILIVDDEKEYRETYRLMLENKGFSVGEASSAEQAINILENEYYPLVISDLMMPNINGLELLKIIKNSYHNNIELIMVTAYGDIESAVDAMKLGAFGYFIKGHNPEELLIEIDKAKRILTLQNMNDINVGNYNNQIYLNQTKSDKMKEVLEIINKVSDTNSNILILGETGVGKEVIAKKIHEVSSRVNMPFVPINCQYFSFNLLESELFGHEKGAFTGADSKRIGRFEEGNGGTIFLDEIGEIPNETQVKFLRVLEERKVERVGSSKKIEVDIRLISATNKYLLEEVKRGRFREDLFYRINTITIEVPPLRDRREDLEDMIYFFVDFYRHELKKDIEGIDKETLEYLLNYNYPGNIRELKNIIERLFVLSKGNILEIDDGISINKEIKNDKKDSQLKTFNEARREFEKEYFALALSKNDNNVTKTAEIIDLSKRQLFNKIKEYNLRDL